MTLEHSFRHNAAYKLFCQLIIAGESSGDYYQPSLSQLDRMAKLAFDAVDAFNSVSKNDYDESESQE